MPNAAPIRSTEIYVSRGGVTIGPPCSPFEARQKLSDRTLSPRDLAWCQGLTDWVPLSDAIDFAEGRAAPVPQKKPVPQKVRKTQNPSSAVMEQVKRATHKTTVLPPVERVMRVRGTGGFHKLSSLLNRNVKKEIIGSEDFGNGLWAFCKSTSREFHVFFRQLLRDAVIELDEDAEFIAVQEIVLMNLWLITHFLPRDRKSINMMHQRYFMRHGKVAGQLGSNEEKLEYLKKAKQIVSDRFALYETMWNSKKEGDQKVLSAYLLEHMIGRKMQHTEAAGRRLVHQFNTYLRAMSVTTAELRERFEVRDSAGPKSKAI